MNYLDDWRHYDADGNLTPVGEAAIRLERAESDAGDFVAVAYAEDYDRDWSGALGHHDWVCNQCTGHDQFGARCWNRQGHKGKHGATFNERLKFAYSEEKIASLIYDANPLLSMVAR
jgi:hypothetical protein